MLEYIIKRLQTPDPFPFFPVVWVIVQPESKPHSKPRCLPLQMEDLEDLQVSCTITLRGGISNNFAESDVSHDRAIKRPPACELSVIHENRVKIWIEIVSTKTNISR